jgi:Asp-tRNA(Asn)/Glu-tRNA(Gln) amidotransferase A subunit family amidase
MVISRHVGGTPPHPGLAGPPALPDARRPGVLIRLDTKGWEEADDATRGAFERLVKTVTDAGVTVIDRRTDPKVEALERTLVDVYDFATDILSWESRWPAGTYKDHGDGMIGQRVHDLVDHADKMTYAQYSDALDRRDALRREVHALRDRADGFLTLCASSPAPQDHGFTGSRSYPIPWTLVGGPAFALPVMAVDGLPLGAQLCGYQHDDENLVRAARWISELAVPAAG